MVYLCTLLMLSIGVLAAEEKIPTTVSGSVAATMQFAEGDLLGAAEAMPEDKYTYIPKDGSFKDARSFGEQIKHVACAHFAFFNEIEAKTPPELCEKGGPSKA